MRMSFICAPLNICCEKEACDLTEVVREGASQRRKNEEEGARTRGKILR